MKFNMPSTATFQKIAAGAGKEREVQDVWVRARGNSVSVPGHNTFVRPKIIRWLGKRTWRDIARNQKIAKGDREMTRRELLKKSLFGSLTIGGLSVVEAIEKSNETIQINESFRSPKSEKPGAIAIAYGDIVGSPIFPIRPKDAIATDGAPVYFLWPSERGCARGYLDFQNKSEIIPQRFVFRLRMSAPEPPYYLHWHKGEYYLYTAPGSLIERASYLMQSGDADDCLQALSDMRQAVILNLTQKGDGQIYINSLSDLDREVRESPDERLRQYWDRYKEILTETRS
jgi:hypothetical protein